MIREQTPLLLGSGSPRRREMLSRLGIPLICRPPSGEVDETPLPGDAPAAYLERVVSLKLEAVAALAPGRERWGALLVADTVVVSGAHILGKPSDDDEAQQMLRSLADTEHLVATRFAISSNLEPAVPLTAQTVETRVWFRPLSDEAIRRYVASGEGRDKAGAYAIQGMGGFLVSRIEGSYHNVVGLPLCQVVLSLQRLGLMSHVPPT